MLDATVETIVVDSGCCNDKPINVLDFSRYAQLKEIEVGSRCFDGLPTCERADHWLEVFRGLHAVRDCERLLLGGGGGGRFDRTGTVFSARGIANEECFRMAVFSRRSLQTEDSIDRQRSAQEIHFCHV